MYDKFLVSGHPKLVPGGMTDTWFVFTDASYEVVDDVATAGFGGVLVDPNGACLSKFGFDLKGDDLTRLNPSAKKTVIHECEFLAVVIAPESWNCFFVAKQIVRFMDNNAVRDSLASGKASAMVVCPIGFLKWRLK